MIILQALIDEIKNNLNIKSNNDILSNSIYISFIMINL